MAADISAQIGIDGEKQFTSSIKAIDGELKALNAEMKSAVAEFEVMDNAEQNSAKRSQILTEQIDKQKSKLAVLESQYARQTSELNKLGEALEQAKKEFGENSEEAGKAQNAYNKQSAEVSKLRTQIANTNTEIAKETKALDELGQETEKTKSKMSVFGDTLKGVLGAELIKAGVTSVVNGIKDITNAFKDGINSAAQYGDQIDKQSQKLQISAEDYQKLAFAAERSGTSIDVMATAQKSLASSGFSGSLMEAIQYVSGIADEEERAAAASELFGKKAGMEMLPLLNSGADGINALYKEYEALGGVMSNEAVAAAAAYEDAMTNLQSALDGVKNQMAGEFLPGVTTVMQGIVEVIKGNTEEGEKLIDEGFNDIQKKITEFTQNAASHAPELLEIGIKLLTALITGIIQSLPTLAAQTPKIIATLVNGIISLLGELAKVGMQMLNTIANELKNGLGEIKQIGRNMVEGLWNGIKERSTWLLSQVRSWCSSILNEVKSFFDINSPSRVMNKEVGVMLGRGMAQGITSGSSYAIDAMRQMGEQVLNASPNITSQYSMQTASNEALAAGLVNGLTGARNAEPVNVSVQLVLQDGRAIAETVFNDLLNVGKQRGVSLA